MWYPGKKIIRDIINYRYLLRTIKQNKESVEFKKFNLRSDWIGRLYTVINLPPEVLYSPDAPEEIRPAYVLEESRPLNEYLTKLNLQEIIIPEIKPISGSNSWLIIYKPYLQKISWRWFLTRIGIGLVLLWSEIRFGILSFIWEKISIAFEYIFGL